ncbi:MAG: translesion DNA synthesis-associated protein ImuA [Betaproteobacteria bacterium]|nr:translesion DNA synthesis-associated protein ImuA [Betaproteobacteria bacterium]
MQNKRDLLGLSTQLWWADGWPQSGAQRSIASGFQALDKQLPSGGWPCGALSELLSKQAGIGELRLLVPVLRQLTSQQKTVVLMSPPMLPYGPALACYGIDLQHLVIIKAKHLIDRLWAIEQCLRSNSLACILAWLPHTDLRPAIFRRLQLAAQQFEGPGFILSLGLRILKRRGPLHHDSLEIELPQSTQGLQLRALRLKAPAGEAPNASALQSGGASALAHHGASGQPLATSH